MSVISFKNGTQNFLAGQISLLYRHNTIFNSFQFRLLFGLSKLNAVGGSQQRRQASSDVQLAVDVYHFGPVFPGWILDDL